MGKTWVANTTNQPKPIDGRMVLPGDGVFVDDGAPAEQRLSLTVIDEAGKVPVLEVQEERYGLIPEAVAQSLVSLPGNGTFTYDGSGRLSTAMKGSRSYTLSYPAGSMIVTAADGAVLTVTLDGQNRATELVGNF